MKVKATMQFDDLQENVKRKKGDIFEVSKERAEFLFSHNAVEFVEEEFVPEVIEIQRPEDTMKKYEVFSSEEGVKTNKSKKRKKK